MEIDQEEADAFFEDLMSPEKKEIVKIEEVIEERDLEEDFKRAKRNLEAIASSTTEAVEDAAILAAQMAEPRGYDALSKIATAATNANKAVVELYKNKVEGKLGDDGKEPTHITNNNTVFLTTAQMAERLREIADRSSS